MPLLIRWKGSRGQGKGRDYVNAALGSVGEGSVASACIEAETASLCPTNPRAAFA